MDIHKKISADICIAILLFVLLVGGIFLANFYFNRTIVLPPGKGPSMEPTIPEGKSVTIDVRRKPAVNDIIVFKCFSKCHDDGSSVLLAKRLTEINEQGCFYVLGDNREHSNDSSYFGWLCPKDIKLTGVVIL